MARNPNQHILTSWEKWGKVGKTTSASELPKHYNQANYARNLVKNKFESVSNTGDDLLQAICKCKKSGEVHATGPKCTGRNCSHFI